MVSITNYGNEMSLIAGYFKPSWHLAGEVNYAKAIATRFGHSDESKDNVYSDIRDGWYSTLAGNWQAGLRGGKSITPNVGLTVRAGVTGSWAWPKLTTRKNRVTMGFIDLFGIVRCAM